MSVSRVLRDLRVEVGDKTAFSPAGGVIITSGMEGRWGRSLHGEVLKRAGFLAGGFGKGISPIAMVVSGVSGLSFSVSLW